jgi:hypothetical protein
VHLLHVLHLLHLLHLQLLHLQLLHLLRRQGRLLELGSVLLVEVLLLRELQLLVLVMELVEAFHCNNNLTYITY